MGVTVLFYKLFQFKVDLAAIMKRYYTPQLGSWHSISN